MAKVTVFGTEMVLVTNPPDYWKKKNVVKGMPFTAKNPTLLQAMVRRTLTASAIANRGTLGRDPGQAPNVAFDIGDDVHAKHGKDTPFGVRSREAAVGRKARREKRATLMLDKLDRYITMKEKGKAAPIPAGERISL